jgi:uncharacterized SAM-binding protein YcdF (DUF218 family)
MVFKKIYKFVFFLGVIGVLLFVLEALYFTLVFENLSSARPDDHLVVIYSGSDDRMGLVREWSEEKPDVLFLFSGWDYTTEMVEDYTGLKSSKCILETRARTTDQNARYSSLLIRKVGVKDVVLALPWYHLPRALFLTRYYLWGSGISVKPYASITLPKGWWLSSWFWQEIVKFWGSWVRVFLAGLGIEDWPKYQIIFLR